MLKHHNLASLLLLSCLVIRTKAQGSCENTILENLKDTLNISSSRSSHYFAKEVLETFFLQANGRNKFNVTKAHRCRDKSLTYEKFLDRTSRHLSKRSVCGNSYYKISVAALAIYLHLDRYICGEHSEQYHLYLDQIKRLDPMYALSRHIHHNKNKSTSGDHQCLNKVKLQRMVSMILQEQPHSQRQHLKHRALNNLTLEAGISKESISSRSPLISSSQSPVTTTTLLESEKDFATENLWLNFMNGYHNDTDIHCFLPNNSTRTFCVGLIANHTFSPFHCSKVKESNVYKCAKYKQNVQSNPPNKTLLLAIVSSFSTENIEHMIQFAEKMDLTIYSLNTLPWVVKYQSCKPMKIVVNQIFSTSDAHDISDGISSETSLSKDKLKAKPLPQTPVQKGDNERKNTQHSNHNYMNNNHNHMTEKEISAGILVYAVIKNYILQPRDLPCPSDVLHQLYTYYKPPESQFLSVKDLQRGIQSFLDDKSVLNHVPSHSHHKRYLTKDTQLHSHMKKREQRSPNHVHVSSSHVPLSSFKHKPHDPHHSIPLINDPPFESTHPPPHGHMRPPPPPAHASEHHGHPPQTHGRSSPCSRLFAPLYNDRHDHRGEKLKAMKWNISDVPDIYFGSSRVLLSLQDLQEMTPALLLLLMERKGDTSLHKDDVTYMQSYGLGTLCVVFLSLASVLGAIFIKITGTKRKAYLLSFMLALSVGCLLGDAVFHLLPSTMGVHEEVNLEKLLILLVTMYGFFFMQLIVSVFHRNHDHSQIFHKESKKSHEFEIAKNEILELENKARQNEIVLNNILKEDKPMERQESNESQKDLTIEECPSESNVSTNDRDIIPAVWMVIIGDCVHNFADGLAIGATFTQSLTEGLSTSIAVLCHEIPHELGDFAILLAAGFTVKKAIMVNLLSSITAFIGLYIGISVGAEFRIWIIAAGGGMFLYISMVTMIPELLRLFRNNTCKEMFFALNLGYIFGVVAMLLLAIYEEELRIV